MLANAIFRVNRFDRTVKVRNWTECGAAVLLAALFTLGAVKSPNDLMRAGNLIVAASGLWIIFYILRFGRSNQVPMPDQTLAGFRQALLRKYEQQIKVLKNVKYWYLLPPYMGLLVLTGGIMQARSAARPGWPELLSIVLVTVVFAVIWWINEGVALGRLRRERARLLEEMNNSTGEHP
ncbi:MAG TPA: hypothetical protein VKR61_18965 [Bryobacteraceae bacterium]|nr:hypothetical protein [Bryobacteraceae bacterium]